MTKVLLNLASGQQLEKELITSFINDGVKYLIFDGESTGSMGLPIILVGKDSYGKVVGITDADEWKTAKDCLKRIISGEEIEYAYVPGELKADDIYYRQLTLPIASFDLLKNSYVAPDAPAGDNGGVQGDNTPIFEPIQPEDIMSSPSVPNEGTPIFNDISQNVAQVETPQAVAPEVAQVVNQEPIPMTGFDAFVPEPYQENELQSIPQQNIVQEPISNETVQESNAPFNNYDELKNEFMAGAEKLFDELYKKFNHID